MLFSPWLDSVRTRVRRNSRNIRNGLTRRRPQSYRQALVEYLETRQVMTSPNFVSVSPNVGGFLQNGDIRTDVPGELVFQFSPGQVIQSSTLGAIHVVGAGHDGGFTAAGAISDFGTNGGVVLRLGAKRLGAADNGNTVSVLYADNGGAGPTLTAASNGNLSLTLDISPLNPTTAQQLIDFAANNAAASKLLTVTKLSGNAALSLVPAMPATSVQSLTGAGSAFALQNFGVSGLNVLFEASTPGESGNRVEIHVNRLDLGVVSSQPRINVVGQRIEVTINENVAAATTATGLVNAINQNNSAALLVNARVVTGTGTSSLATTADGTLIKLSGADRPLSASAAFGFQSAVPATGIPMLMQFAARQQGLDGNDISLQFNRQNLGAGSPAPTISVSGKRITVTLNTNATAFTKADDLVTALGANVAANALISARVINGDGATSLANVTNGIVVQLGGADAAVNPGFRGLLASNREVVYRFGGTLADDLYRLEVIGTGSAPLTNTAGEAVDNGQDTFLDVDLDLGAQVTSVVPQPILRDQQITVGSVAKITDGDTITVNPGTGTGVFVFEFNDTAVQAAGAVRSGNIAIDINKSTATPATVATAIANAINTATLANPDVTASAVGATVSIRGGSFDVQLKLNLRDVTAPLAISQPVGGGISQLPNQIQVYFTNDDLIDSSGVAENPAFYQLVDTKGTSSPADDTITLPVSVNYDPALDMAVLIFGTAIPTGTFKLKVGSSQEGDGTLVSAVELGTLFSGSGYTTTATTGDNGGGPSDIDLYKFQTPASGNLSVTITPDAAHNTSVRLLDSTGAAVGTAVITNNPAGFVDLLSAAGLAAGTYFVEVTSSAASTTGSYRIDINTTATISGSDDNSSYANATSLGTLGAAGKSIAALITTQVLIPIPTEPGSNDEPGHRTFPIFPGEDESHNGGTTFIATPSAITVRAYSFPDFYGTFQGAPLFNQITPGQKELVRGFFAILSHYTGVQFEEVAQGGLGVISGDPRVVMPNIFPGGIAGGSAIINAALNSDEAWGGGWMNVMMHEVGHSLGLAHSSDLPGSIMAGGSEASGLQTPKPAETALTDWDITHFSRRFQSSSTDIDLYKFDVATAGTFSAEITAERQLPTTSRLDAALALFRDPFATATSDFGMSGATISFTAANAGAFGNDIRLNITKSAHAGATIGLPTFAVSGHTITVDLDSNGTTANAFINAFNLNAQVSVLVKASLATAAATGTSNIAAAATVPFIALSGGNREIITRNDDYYGKDSYLNIQLQPGTYYVGVSAKGNTSYDPTVSDTGSGGQSDGNYRLQLGFTSNVMTNIADSDSSTATALDGDADNKPGGALNFWFESGTTIYVDKATTVSTGLQDGTIARPFSTIGAATAKAASRIVVPTTGPAFDAVNNVGINDGDYFTISDGVHPAKVFEFDKDGGAGVVTQSNIRVNISAALNASDVATAIAAAINGATSPTFATTAVATIVSTTNAYVDLTNSSTLDVSGVTNPATTSGLLTAQNLIRIVGNGGTDNDVSTIIDNTPYLVGLNNSNVTLADGRNFDVPQGTTVTVDAGAILKLQSANIDVGSAILNVDRQDGALQLLGTPTRQVYMTSFRNDLIGGDSDGSSTGPFAGQWGGIVLREDSDMNDNVFGDRDGNMVFLNSVYQANLSYGGGQVSVNSVVEVYDPIHILSERPTIAYSTIVNSNDAAISADPNSFDDSNGRIGPDIHKNLLGGSAATNNSLNGLFIRIKTDANGTPIDKLSANGRFNDTDITHIITENLQIVGNAGGTILSNEIQQLDILGQPTAGFFTLNYNGAAPTELTTITKEVLTAGQTTITVADSTKLRAPSSVPFDIIVGTERMRVTNITNNVLTVQRGVDGTTAAAHGYTASTTLTAAVNGSVTVMPFLDTSGFPITRPIAIKIDNEEMLLTTAGVTRGFNGTTPAPHASGATVSILEIVTLSLKTVPLPSTSTPAQIQLALENLAGVGPGGVKVTGGDLPQAPVYIEFALQLGSQNIAPLTVNNAPTDTTPVTPMTNGVVKLNTVTEGGVSTARPSGRLLIDPGTVVKLGGARIEAERGTSSLIAEGLDGRPVIFTSLQDDRYGAGSGTFDLSKNGFSAFTSSNANAPKMGDWGGLVFQVQSNVSLDHSYVAFAGGQTPIQGGSGSFNPLEIHEATARVANTTFEFNANGASNGGPDGQRGNRETNDAAVIFVLGAQPILVNNVFKDNNGAVISIDPDAMKAINVIDSGRSTGSLSNFPQFADNQGPLVRLNRMSNDSDNPNLSLNAYLGMRVRPGALDTQTVWDDTDIVHILTAAPISLLQTPLVAGIGAGTLQFNVTDASVFPATPFTVAIGGEWMTVTGVNGNQLTVTRAATGGSAASAHAAGDQVSLVTGIADFMFHTSGGLRLQSAPDASLVVKLGPSAGFDIGSSRIGLIDIPDRIGASMQVVGAPGFPVVLTSLKDDQVGAGLDPLGFPQTDNDSNNTALTASFTGPFNAVTNNTLFVASNSRLPGGNFLALVDHEVMLVTRTGMPANQLRIVAVGQNGTSATNHNAGAQIGIAPIAGDWDRVLFDKYSNDTNFVSVNEIERPLTGGTDINGTVTASLNNAQFLGDLAPNLKTADEHRRGGYEVHGYISVDSPKDVDVYSFTADAGTEIWLDIDKTDPSLDTVLEVIDANGNVLARSQGLSNSLAPVFTAGTPITATTLTKAPEQGGDFYATTIRDAGMRVTLNGTGTGTYFVRVRSNPASTDQTTTTNLTDLKGGLTSGQYQLQIRLQQRDQQPGVTVRFADIRYATTGIDVKGLPYHSPLTAESGEITDTNPIPALRANDSRATSQFLGNLMASDQNSVGVAGEMLNASDIDFYQFDLGYQAVQIIPGANGLGMQWSGVIDLDWADGLTRPDTTLALFDSNGRVIFIGRASNVQDDQRAPGQNNDTDLTRGSAGTHDAFIGPISLPAVDDTAQPVRYYLAVANNQQIPSALTATFDGNDAQRAVRLEPINSIRRIAEDHIGFTGYNSNGANVDPIGAIDASNAATGTPSSSVPLLNITNRYSLSNSIEHLTFQDLVLYTHGLNNLFTNNPLTGNVATRIDDDLNLGGPPTNFLQDVVMRSDGVLYGYQRIDTNNGTNTNNSRAGQLVTIDTGTGAIAPVGTGSDNIASGSPPAGSGVTPGSTNYRNFEQVTNTDDVDALTFQRTGFSGGAPTYGLYYAVRENGVSATTGGASTFNSKLYRADPNTGSAAIVSGQPFGVLGDIQLSGVRPATNFFPFTSPGPISGSIGFQTRAQGTQANGVQLVITRTGGATQVTSAVNGIVSVNVNYDFANNAGTTSIQTVVDVINAHAGAQRILTASVLPGSNAGTLVTSDRPLGSAPATGGTDDTSGQRIHGNIMGMAFGQFTGGTLYAVTSGEGTATTGSQLISINTSTGAATIIRDFTSLGIGTTGGPAVSDNGFQGLALGPQNAPIVVGTLAGDIDAGTASFTLNTINPLPTAPFDLLVGNELMSATAAGNVVTVTRTASVAVGHSTGDSVSIPGYFARTLLTVTQDGRMLAINTDPTLGAVGSGMVAFDANFVSQNLGVTGTPNLGSYFTLSFDEDSNPVTPPQTTDPIAYNAPDATSLNDSQFVSTAAYSGNYTLSFVNNLFDTTSPVDAIAASTAGTTGFTFDVEDRTGFSVNSIISVEGEDMLLTAITPLAGLTATFTVTRGIHSVGAVPAHADTATVFEVLTTNTNGATTSTTTNGATGFVSTPTGSAATTTNGATGVTQGVDIVGVDTSSFPSSGTIRIGSEDITYTGNNGVDTLTGITRGVNSTAILNHPTGATISLRRYSSSTTSDINAVSTAAFPTAGTIRIGTEDITYTGTTATSFTGITRGANGTTAANHSVAAPIYLVSDAATTVTDINAVDTTNFPTSGTIRIGTEDISYTGTTATSFTGVTRGANGTTIVNHLGGTPIYPVSGVGNVIDVVDTTSFPASGTIRIDSEDITYTGTTPTSFTGVTRGANGTTIAAHLSNATISRVLTTANISTAATSAQIATAVQTAISVVTAGTVTGSATTLNTNINLLAGLSITGTTVTVASTADFPTSGLIRIDSEDMTYSGKTANTLTGLARGVNGTVATSHANGALITMSGTTLVFSGANLAGGADLGFRDLPQLTADPTNLSPTGLVGNEIQTISHMNGPVQTTSGLILAGDTVIPVSSTTGFTAPGTLLIDGEQITYTTLTATQFGTIATGVVRGANGTAAAQHTAGSTVYSLTSRVNVVGGIMAGDNIITVTSTAGFPARGTIQIDGEQITYTARTATTFGDASIGSFVTRGVNGTGPAVAHAQGAGVVNVSTFSLSLNDPILGNTTIGTLIPANVSVATLQGLFDAALGTGQALVTGSAGAGTTMPSGNFTVQFLGQRQDLDMPTLVIAPTTQGGNSVASNNERQWLLMSPGAAFLSTFTLTVPGNPTTANISFNATANAVQTALNATLGTTTVTVTTIPSPTGGTTLNNGAVYVIDYTGAGALDLNVGTVVVDNSGMNGATVGTATPIDGDNTSYFALETRKGLSFSAATSPISTIQDGNLSVYDALVGLAGINPTDVSVTAVSGSGIPASTDLILFTTLFGGQPAAPLIVDNFGMSGPGPASAVITASGTIDDGLPDSIILSNPALSGSRGLAFSPLDVNLWHPTAFTNSGVNAVGHGVNATPDNSRDPSDPLKSLPRDLTYGLASNTNKDAYQDSQGGASMYFGLEEYRGGGGSSATNYYAYQGADSQLGVLNDQWQRDLTSNPNIGNTAGGAQGNYNTPGGAFGKMTTNTIDLSGYTAADKPTFYFNYLLDTGDGTPTAGSTLAAQNMRDSARVFVSTDGGTNWELIATNNAQLTVNFPMPAPAELGLFLADDSTYGAGSVQQLFSTNTWRQARVDLSSFVGSANVKFRFDFSTAGSMGEAIDPDATVLPGDAAGQFSAELGDDQDLAARRGQNNNHTGFLIDDLIVGFAERGEMVTYPAAAPVVPTTPFTDLYSGFANSRANQTAKIMPAPPVVVGNGTYQFEIRRGAEYNTFGMDIAIPGKVIPSVTTPFDTNDRLIGSQYDTLGTAMYTSSVVPGDQNVPRPQGMVVIEGNFVRDISGSGIVVEPGARDNNGSFTYPGVDRNTPVDNASHLVTSVMIQNNVIANFGGSNSGIEFRGDPGSGASPQAAVPMGKIVNNTIYGSLNRTGTGIRVADNAGPTIINNIIANTSLGISVDATSAPNTDVTTTLFQNVSLNGTTDNFGTVGSFAVLNSVTASQQPPLFLNPSVGNFYLAPSTVTDPNRAIDSSLNTRIARGTYTPVTTALGIPVQNLFSPDFDIYGQQRVTDKQPNFDTSSGLGQNIFKDRGAIELADFSGPVASLNVVPDNTTRVPDNQAGVDFDPSDNSISLDQPPLLTKFVVSLFDPGTFPNAGVGVDDSSAGLFTGSAFVITQVDVTNYANMPTPGRVLVQNVDYTYAYNANTNEAIFTSVTLFPSDARYNITIDATQVTDTAGNLLQPNQSADGSTQFNILVTNGPNDPPVNAVPLGRTINENTAAAPTSVTFSAAGGNAISVFDPDAFISNAPNELEVTLTGFNGTVTLPANYANFVTLTSGTGVNDASVKFSGKIANINLMLAGGVLAADQLTFVPTQDYSSTIGVVKLQVTTNDLGNFSNDVPLIPQVDVDDIIINVLPINTAPTATSPATASTNEDVNLTFSGNVSISDALDDPTGAVVVQATVSVTNGVLSLNGATGLTFVPTGTNNDGTNDATMTFQGTVANINAALNGMIFDPNQDYNGNATLSVSINDMGNIDATVVAPSPTDPLALTAMSTTTITINPVNDAPVNLYNSGATFPAAPLLALERTPFIFNSGNGGVITVSDLDAAESTGALQVTLTATHGVLTLASTSGLTVTGDGTSNVTLTGLIATLNTALNGLRFDPDSGFTTVGAGEFARVTILTNDLGATGTGNLTDSDFIDLDVLEVNDTPVVTGPATATINEEGTLTFSLANGNAITASDIDAGSNLVRITASAANGVITFASTAGLTLISGMNGTSTVELEGTLANIQVALNAGVDFDPTPDYFGNTSVTFSVNDQGFTGNGGPRTGSTTVAVTLTGLDDAPVITVPSVSQVAVEDTNFVFSTGIGNAISISDVDDPLGTGSAIYSVALSLSTPGFPLGKLTLAAGSGVSITMGGNGTSAISFTGTLLQINAALNGLTYLGAPGQDTGTETLTVVVNDPNFGMNATLTDTATVAISLDGNNDAPVNTVPVAQTMLEDGTLVFSTANGNLISTSDIDASNGVLLVTVSVTGGTVSVNPAAAGALNSLTSNGTSSLSMTGLLSELQAALDGLSFTPANNFVGVTTLTITTNDQGNTGAPPLNPLSDTDTVQITTTPSNDAPTVAVQQNPLLASEDTVLTISAANTNGVSMDDFDLGSGQPRVTLTVTHGTLTLSRTTGLNFVGGPGTGNGLSTMTFTGTSKTAINAALDGMQYRPTAGYNGSASLTVTVNDQGNTGAGGPQEVTVTVPINVGAVNDAPTLTVPSATQTLVEDASKVFSTVGNNAIVVADIDVNEGSGQVEVQLTVSNGTLTLGSLNNISFTSGGNNQASMLIRGPISDINLALNGLAYRPNQNFNGSDSLSVTVSDLGNTGSGGIKTASGSVSLAISAENDAPVNTLPSGPVSTNEETAVSIGSISVSDVDAGSSLVQVTLAATNGKIGVGPLSGGVTIAGGSNNSGSVTLSGTISALQTTLGTASFTPNTDFSGLATVTVTTTDQGATGAGGAMTDSDSFSITVNPLNDLPVGVNDTYSVLRGGTLTTSDVAGTETGTAGDNGVLANDTDVDSPRVGWTATLVSPPANHSGTFTLNPDGTFTYIHDGLSVQPVTFTYRISDGTSLNPTDVTVTININEPPQIAAAGPFSINENLTNSSVVADLDASDNNSGDTVTFSILSGNTGGAFAINPSTGVISVANSAALNFETNPIFSLTIQAADNAVTPGTSTTNVIVNLNDLSEAVTISSTLWMDSGLTLRLGAGNRLRVVNTGTDTSVFEEHVLSKISSLTVNGRNGFSDPLTLDFSGGTPVPATGLLFNGGSGAGSDSLDLINGIGFSTITHNFTNANSGNVTLLDGAVTSVVTYSGLEASFNPASSNARIFDNLGAVNRVFSYSSVADKVTLVDDDTGGNSLSTIKTGESNGTGATAERVIFRVPSSLLTISLGDGNDSVIGTSIDAAFVGTVSVLAGNGEDSIDLAGLTTSTFVDGQNGNDTLKGGAGDDVLVGSNDQDLMDGRAGNDNLIGGAGIDTLTGGAGSNILNGNGTSTDLVLEQVSGVVTLTNTSLNWTGGTNKLSNVELASLVGGSGNDSFNLSGWSIGSPTVSAGGGDDTILGSALRDILNGDGGNDSINGGEGLDVLIGGVGNDILFGDGGDDALFGEIGDDQLYGGSGNDTLSGAEGVDTLLGNGSSGDMLIETMTANTLTLTSNAAFTTGFLTIGAVTEVVRGIEKALFYGTAGADKINTEGYFGATEISSGDGNDTIATGSGFDIVRGEAGDDKIKTGASNDIVYGLDGNDTIDGGDGDDYLNGNNGNDVITGNAGNDKVFGELGNDTLLGGIGNDSLAGREGDDSILGEAGNDTIRGETGADKLAGGGNGTTRVAGDILVSDSFDTINDAFMFDFPTI